MENGRRAAAKRTARSRKALGFVYRPAFLRTMYTKPTNVITPRIDAIASSEAVAPGRADDVVLVIKVRAEVTPMVATIRIATQYSMTVLLTPGIFNSPLYGWVCTSLYIYVFILLLISIVRSLITVYYILSC
jgi:hypothetical protein